MHASRLFMTSCVIFSTHDYSFVIFINASFSLVHDRLRHILYSLGMFIYASFSLVHDILRHTSLYPVLLISHACLSMQASRLSMIFRVNVCH
jgi:hypothetical protein